MKKFAVSLIVSALMTASLFSTAAFAAEFTSSIENKGAPSVTMMTDQSGQQAAAIIKDADGNEVIGVPDGDLIVTPIAKAHEASSDIREKLENAYGQIKSAATLDDLAAGLSNAVHQLSSGVVPEYADFNGDLVVRDIFDVSVYGTYADYLAIEGNTITVTFDLGLDSNAFLAVLHNYSDSNWELISSDRIERHSNGNVSVTFDSLSPVAFVVDNGEVAIDTNGPVSPQTGDIDFGGWGIGAAAFAGAAAACFAKSRKRNK